MSFLRDGFQHLWGLNGDNLSPALFAIYINDLAHAIKSLNCGVQCGKEMVSILLCVDEIVIIAETEQDMQKILSCTRDWCEK